MQASVEPEGIQVQVQPCLWAGWALWARKAFPNLSLVFPDEEDSLQPWRLSSSFIQGRFVKYQLCAQPGAGPGDTTAPKTHPAPHRGFTALGLQGDCLEQYQCGERRMYKSENECRFSNICVILASLKMFFHIHHLLYHLTINVDWIHYEPSSVQYTRVQVSNEIDIPSALPKDCCYNSVRWAGQEWSRFPDVETGSARLGDLPVMVQYTGSWA